ncbi:hypothetical protein StoSoilB13_01510 [Arthrobacter sp. StoSoilB13]|nr:hypothetical protein StoSoilB13_01510 [Arthrobacter sp. StoSoilB13]
MARSQTPARKGEPLGDFTENIVDIDVTSEMEGSFLEYAYSVIYSRALPDARDGLKPVQRRILYMMADMGLRPDRGHVKSARVVGEVMGKLHPHGDAAIYDAMVRMAQDFSLRLPLIDGHGNFGSLDDGPAAPRYTEARLAAAALTMTDHLDEDVVDFVPNYDNQLTQPDVLPAAFPNLLVNGTTGIAVGMATNMAPHNLVEVIAAARHLIANPDATLDDIMKYVPGPDLPTGGRIVGLDGIRDAYATGPRFLQDARQGGSGAAVCPPDRPGGDRAALHGWPGKGHRKDQGRRQRQEVDRHQRRRGPHGPQPWPAAGH